MKKVFVLILVAAILLSGLLFSACNKSSGEVTDGLGYFSSRNEIIKRIEQYASMKGINKSNWLTNLFTNKMALPIPPVVSDSAVKEDLSSSDYTRTNTQVEGIDEGDIIKADGNHIYILSQSGFYIVKADNGNLQKLSNISLENYVPQEMYVEGNKLILIGGIYEPYKTNFMMDLAAVEMPGCIWYPTTVKTDIRVYDISDKTAPVLGRQITLSGNYNTSRLIDGTFYYMINYNFYYGNKDTYIPKISDSGADGGAEKEIPVQDINFFDGIPNFNYLITGKIKLDDSQSAVKAYLGAGGTIYVSQNNIYVACTDYSERIRIQGNTQSYDNSSKNYTRIIRINIKDLAYTGIGSVEGEIKDRYSLDEYDGYLRIATNTWYYDNSGFKRYSSVFVLDGSLKTVGTITNIAPGENIYSVRFKGTEGALVTFRQVDPLYKLDFTDPINPKISEGLKKDGVSMYLHYIEGTNYIIGLGKDTEENEWGGVTWKGIEVVLFDKSGADAEIVNTIYIGNASSYAEALYNPKAILYDKNLNIFAFAAEAWVYDYNGNYQHKNAQGYYVFGIEDGKLVQRAFLTDIRKEIQYNDQYQYYDYVFSQIKRGARIGNHIYTISDRYVTSYSLADFSETAKLELAKISISENGITITK